MTLKTFWNVFRKFDKFGEPVKILYKGEDLYTTKIGALVSIGVYILVLS